MLTNVWGIHPLEMPDPKDTKRVEAWAMYVLELGRKGDYDLLIHFLSQAKEVGCLTKIREAAERLVRARAVVPKGGVKRTRTKTGMKAA